jgi:hypothetical protein
MDRNSEPLQGVKVEVFPQLQSPMGSNVSDASGRFLVPLPVTHMGRGTTLRAWLDGYILSEKRVTVSSLPPFQYTTLETKIKVVGFIIIIGLLMSPQAQAFLMDYPQGERAITHHTGPVRIGGCSLITNL